MNVPRELIERRVPQYLATYAGVSFGIVQFIDFLQSRYSLSPHWTDLSLLGLALLIPSVALFTYHHGKPGKDELVRSERIGIPLNIVVTVVLLFVLFRQKDLRAVTAPITVMDESGQQVEKRVATASYRKRFALFNFDGPATDTATAWLRYALPIALSTDLVQDMFVDARISVYFRERLRQLGYKDEVNVPLSLKRQLAEEQHLQYFTDGKVSRSGNQYTVDLGLYEASTGKQVNRHTFRGTDVFALVDEMSESLKKDLDVPETQDVKDLPVSEVLTPSLAAFRDYAEGITAIQIHDQWPAAVQHLEKAVAKDSTFAAAQLSLHNILVMSNQTEKAMPPLQKAMDHLYRLPERLSYDVKAEYYLLKQEKDKAYNIAKMKTTVYPQDISGFALLAQLQQLRDDKAGMIGSYQAILKLDPTQHEYERQIGALYQAQGDFKSALNSYVTYAEKFPTRPEAFIPIAALYRLQGDHQKARANYDKALTIDPANVGAMIGLGTVQVDVGEFDAGLEQFNDALAAAKTADDRGKALKSISDYYEARGELKRSINYFDQALAELRKTSPPFVVAVAELSELGTYVKAGMSDVAKRTVDRLSKELQPPFNMFLSIGQMEVAVEQERPDAAEAAVAVAEQSIQAFGFVFLKPLVSFARGQIAELRGQCNQAIKFWEEGKKLEPTDAVIHTHIARCYRTLNEPQKAIEQAQLTLKTRPFHPRANYELALAYLAAGDRAKALEPLRRAVLVWSNADPNYELAAEAKAKLKEVEAGGPK